jgi:hypothetical protein
MLGHRKQLPQEDRKMKNAESNATINHEATRAAGNHAEFDAAGATRRLAGEVQAYLAETPAQHWEKMTEQSAPLRDGATGFVRNVLSEGMKQGAELKKGADGLNKMASDSIKNYPLESTLTGVGNVGALGCGAIAVAATAPEIVGLGTLGVVGFGGLAAYNAAAPSVKNFCKDFGKMFGEASTVRPQW